MAYLGSVFLVKFSAEHNAEDTALEDTFFFGIHSAAAYAEGGSRCWLRMDKSRPAVLFSWLVLANATWRVFVRLALGHQVT
jgi:hypothetical protein